MEIDIGDTTMVQMKIGVYKTVPLDVHENS
jgi:hypothetical protein